MAQTMSIQNLLKMIQVPEVVKSFSPKSEKSRNKGLLTSKGIDEDQEEEIKDITDHQNDSQSPHIGNTLINIMKSDNK